MRLTINQAQLSHHLEKVKALIPNRPTHSILGNFVLKASIGKLTISAFNLSQGIKTVVAAEVSETGTITVPAKLFAGLIASLPNQSLTLEAHISEEFSDGILWVNSTDSKYQVRYLSVDDYPAIPSVEESETISIKLEKFTPLLNPVLSTYTNDETKQVLVGVHFTSKNNTLELASTDGHRLSVTQNNIEEEKEPLNNNDSNSLNLTIPGAALEYVFKNIKELDPESNIVINWNEELVKFSFSETEITTRLLQGVYPNYNELIPPQFKVKLTFISNDMIEAIKRLLLLNPDKNIIVIEANKNLQTLTVTTLDTGVGKGSEIIHAELNFNLKMGFDGKYFFEAIKALDSKSITLNINTPTSPAVLVPTECTLNRSLVLVMPMFIKDSEMYIENKNNKDSEAIINELAGTEVISNNPSTSEKNIESVNNSNNNEPINEDNLSSETIVDAQDIPVSPETLNTQELTESIPNSPVEENQPMIKKKTTKKKRSVAVA